ncbi:PKD domain-containing protein [Nocardioides nematodiphilus]|uniref:PKD domain-containing protein n=1 Tax=Nocardioides nematodiphilus TaxID=2849669 RepID=UPI001CD92190|nr:PKD domain-containing protein [Nocardioides nematodiphilus]MCA1983985.1 PKD domain-containing protein [Nocardioides nematodiphilus]
MRRLALTLVAGSMMLVGMVVGSAQPASAGKVCGWAATSDGMEWRCTDTATQTQDGSQGGTQGTWTPPTEWSETRYIPTCSTNGPEDGADVLCGAAVNTCAEDGAIRFWVYVRTVFADPDKKPTDWEMKGSECRGPDAPTEVVPKITRQNVIDAAKALAPKATFAMQPAAQSYVNIPNNFYATAPDETVPITLFGNTIPVRFSAGTVRWDFGDGSTGEGVGIESAGVGQAGAVEHAYVTTGAYDITVTTSYHVVFDLLGQHVETDLVAATSAPQTLEVGEIQTLVTDAR